MYVCKLAGEGSLNVNDIQYHLLGINKDIYVSAVQIMSGQWAKLCLMEQYSKPMQPGGKAPAYLLLVCRGISGF